MEYATKTRWQIRVAALVIFLLGFTAGILTLNVYRAWAYRNPSTPEDRFEKLSSRLQLTAEQKPKVQQILNETREQLRALRKESEPRVVEIRRQADERMQQTLTPEQWQRFQQLKAEMGERRHRRDADKP